MDISIIIPVKPEGAISALTALDRVKYPAASFEVLVAEGCRPSRQRNRAAARAAGDILYFLDDDSLAAPGNLSRLARHFADPGIVGVGGPSLTPATDSILQQGFGKALGSVFGGGSVRNRYRKTGVARATDDSELILCNFALRASHFRAIGGFDERLYPNEENELIDRILKSGGTLLHDPEIPVYRSQRRTFRAFLRQMYTYGRGRGEQTVISGRIHLAALVPSLFLLYLLTLPFIHYPVYYLPLLCYAIAVMVFSVHGAGPAKKPGLIPLLAVIFPAMHLAYGAGLILGLIRPRFRRPVPDEEVTVRVVKEMADPCTAPNDFIPGSSPVCH